MSPNLSSVSSDHFGGLMSKWSDAPISSREGRYVHQTKILSRTGDSAPRTPAALRASGGGFYQQ